jgi:alanyl-tRNA synthetase
MELCGGTHVKNTANIWYFKIVSEGAVAAGIRRIEAITNVAAKDFFLQQSHVFNEIKNVLKNGQDPLKSIISLQDDNAKLKKQIEQLLKEKAKQMKSSLMLELETLNGVAFLAKTIDLDANGAKDLAYEMGQNKDNLFLVFGTITDDKPMLTCYISKELVENKKWNAGQVVRELGKYIQGGGGGQPFFATAGGKNTEGLKTAIEEARKFVTA